MSLRPSRVGVVGRVVVALPVGEVDNALGELLRLIEEAPDG